MSAAGEDGPAFATPTGAGFADAVTLAFGDARAGVYGLARIGVAPGDPASVSALGLLFAGGDVVESVVEGGAAPDGADWGSLRAGPLAISTEEPPGAWRLLWDGVADLRFAAVSPPLARAGATWRETSGCAGWRARSRWADPSGTWPAWDSVAAAGGSPTGTA